MKPTQLIQIIFLVFIFYSCHVKKHEIINLSGEWNFKIQSVDSVEWIETKPDETVQLPGSMAENGKGFDITPDTKWTGGVRNPDWYKDPNYAPYFDSAKIRFPYWLQPVKKFTGAAWYEKKVTIPNTWLNKTVWLNLERPHWETTVFVNFKKIETQNSLATPHIYDISDYWIPGENTITIKVDNRTKKVDVGHDSHSISDHTQSNWNGIVGEMVLLAKGEIYFENVEVFPDVKNKKVEIRSTVNNTTPFETTVKIPVFAKLKNSDKKLAKKTFEFEVSPGINILKMTYTLGENALLWDEFNLNVYELSLQLNSKKSTDFQTVDFGLREFKVDNTRFSINGRPVFLRGTLECAIFPLTGYPSTKNAGWVKVFSAVKAHGLNHVRFHSWCPPDAAFRVADSMGVYLQVECSSWANSTTQLGSGYPIDRYIWDESKRIVKTYGNHPSFVMMAYGNEPGGPKYREFLTKFVTYWKEKDNRRVYTGASGWPVLEVNDYHDLPQPRIQGWGEELRSIINSQPPKTNYDWSAKLPGDGIPVVSHEIGQWCVYPNFKEMAKYTGVLKPKNFEIFKESLTAHHMENLADSFLLASGKLQALCYKADIEAALRTPGFAGFQLLDLHDFPGQGTALVGVLDPFWEEKGYVSPDEYSRFCNSTVPLARLEKLIYIEGETMTADIEVAHFGAKPLEDVNPAWKLIQNDKIVAEGTLGQQNIPLGNAISLGKVVYQFQKNNLPRKMTLEVAVNKFVNSWDIWVYPENISIDSDEIKVVEKLDPATVKILQEGGSVLLSLGQGKVTPEMGGKVGVGFSSIFWNTAWTGGQKPHTLGILCNPEHPALELFPTEYHSNWQWQDAMSHADAIQLDSFKTQIKPIVRIIDDWVSNRQLALIFEVKFGNGKLLVSGTDLANNLENRPEARQLKMSLMNYMCSVKFDPKESLTMNEIQKMLK